MLVNSCTTAALVHASSSRERASIRGRVGNHARRRSVGVRLRTSSRKRSIDGATYDVNMRSSVSGVASSPRIAGGKARWNVQSVHAQVKPYRSRRNV